MRQSAPYQPLAKLPPKAELIETIKILRQTIKSSAALAELKGIAETIPNQKMLVNAIILQEAKDSSEIENIITTQDELYKALVVNKSTISPQTKEVVNYRQAISEGAELIKKQGFLRVNDIINLQQLLLENTAGIRSMPGTVLKNDKTGKVVYTPPQDKQEIQNLLDNFIEHYNLNPNNTPHLVQLAVLHHQFESIHPFYDGNGRTGRILNILYLIMNGLLDLPILYLSSYITEHKADYYRLLNHTNKTGEWEDWILFMLMAMEETSRQTISKIKKIRTLLKQTIKEVQVAAPKTYRKELIELLFEQPYSKIEYVVNHLGVERKAASRYLSELEKIGILEAQKIGRETVYINKALIETLKR